MEGQIIMAGDFNQVMDGMTDRSRPSGKSKIEPQLTYPRGSEPRGYVEISEPL